MRTIDITSLGFGKVGKAFWFLSDQRQPKMEKGFGLLMDLNDIVNSEAK